MLGIISVVALLALGFIWGRQGKMQAATLYIGKTLGAGSLDMIGKRGFQDAITPSYQSWLNLLVPILVLSFLVFAFVSGWKYGSAGIVGLFFAYLLSDRTANNDLEYYALRILKAMHNRQADFAKAGDSVRAAAQSSVNGDLERLIEKIHGTKQPVPKMKESRQLK